MGLGGWQDPSEQHSLRGGLDELASAEDPRSKYGPGARVKSLAVPEADCLPGQSERARLFTGSGPFTVSIDNLKWMVRHWIA